MSLKLALEILGFRKCYHFTELLKRRHAAKWLAITDGRPADWDILFRGYAATVDWPGAAYYRELAEHFPQAKVILTVRDPDEWHASLCGALVPLRRTLTPWIPWAATLGQLTDRIIWHGTFAGRAAEREFAVALFDRHNRDVRSRIDAERLLVFDVKQGWGPLCSFLGRPVPAVPFPRVNSRSSIRAAVWLIRACKLLAIALLVLLGAGALVALAS